MKKIFIAGPYHGANSLDVDQHTSRAEELGLRVAEMGGLPVIPHTMYRYWGRTLNADYWPARGIELLDVCDAVYVVAGYQSSRGTLAEISRAIMAGMRVFYSERPEDMERLREFIKSSGE